MQGWIYIVLKDMYTILDILIHSKEEKLKKIKTVFRGFREGIRFRPVIEEFGK